MKPWRKEEGFTVVEVLISMLVLALAIIPMLTVFDSGLRGSNYSWNKLRAIALAEDTLEDLRGQRWDDVQPATDTVGSFRRTVEVNTVSSFLKDVTVTVSWPERGGNRQISLRTLVSGSPGE